jgi:hypothetical protein
VWSSDNHRGRFGAYWKFGSLSLVGRTSKSQKSKSQNVDETPNPSIDQDKSNKFTIMARIYDLRSGLPAAFGHNIYNDLDAAGPRRLKRPADD